MLKGGSERIQKMGFEAKRKKNKNINDKTTLFGLSLELFCR